MHNAVNARISSSSISLMPFNIYAVIARSVSVKIALHGAAQTTEIFFVRNAMERC